MTTLFLIRHAKSSWDDTALPDKDRPLGDRGRRDAPKMGKRLAKRDVKPDLILSSPARRALTTAEIIAKKLDYKLKDIVVDDRLYAGAVHSLLNVIHGLGDKPERASLRSVRSRGETSARPTSQEWRSTIQRKRNRRATHRLSDYHDGYGDVPQDYAKAREWFKKAADKGLRLAGHDLFEARSAELRKIPRAPFPIAPRIATRQSRGQRFTR